MKRLLVQLKRVYEDEDFDGQESRWVLIGDDGKYFSYFGSWLDDGLKEGSWARLYYTETEKGDRTFRNIKDWDILTQGTNTKFDTAAQYTPFQKNLKALQEAKDIAEIQGEEDVLEVAEKVKTFLTEEEQEEKGKRKKTLDSIYLRAPRFFSRFLPFIIQKLVSI